MCICAVAKKTFAKKVTSFICKVCFYSKKHLSKVKNDFHHMFLILRIPVCYMISIEACFYSAKHLLPYELELNVFRNTFFRVFFGPFFWT